MSESTPHPESPQSPEKEQPAVRSTAENEATQRWESTDEEPSHTLAAPTLPGSVTQPYSVSPRATPFPEAGERIDDFELLKELGRGAMGVVFLAKQISLGREVALKVSHNVGDEARTMASLEHRHIVQVFSESVLSQRNLRLLCMQFVPGVTLEEILRQVRADRSQQLEGARLIEIVDAASTGPALLDPQALRDREQLSNSDFLETVCWLGMRLAEALAYAHRRGVLHRDIKPANVLVDQYGHPRLADFSLSSRVVDDEESRESLFGGTLNYMAPEHLQAFARQLDQAEVGETADIYALGLVLYEMLTMEVPGVDGTVSGGRDAMVQQMIDRRRQPPPSLRRKIPQASAALERTLRRCLDPDPAKRFQSAEELVAALRGCLQLRQTETALPQVGWLTNCCQRWPVLCIILLAVAPHLASSIENISYNIWIVTALSDVQRAMFDRLILVYNLVVYPICLWAMVQKIVLPAVRYRRVVQGGEPATAIDFDVARRQVLSWPRWGAGLAALGWFPGAVYFPLGLHMFAGPIEPRVAAHLIISIALSGLIAITYSVVGLQLVGLRVFYPALWDHAEQLRATAREELQPVGRWLRLSQVLAGLIPLVGAILLVAVGPTEMTGFQYRIYQFLVIALIGLGLGGFQLALTVADRLHKTIDAMTGSDAAENGA